MIKQMAFRVQMDKIRENFTKWLKDNGVDDIPTEKIVRYCFEICFSKFTF